MSLQKKQQQQKQKHYLEANGWLLWDDTDLHKYMIHVLEKQDLIIAEQHDNIFPDNIITHLSPASRVFSSIFTLLLSSIFTTSSSFLYTYHTM